MRKISVFVLLSFLSFIFCTKNPANESNPTPGNHAPVIVSMTAVPAVLKINMIGQIDSTIVTVIVTDIDDTSLTYTFNAALGKLSNQNGKEITYTPPIETGNYVVSCTVSDGEASYVDSVSVPVLPPDPLSKIAFIYHDEIYVINADGSNLIRLTDDDDRGKCHPSWSPDGSKIAFGAVTGEIGDITNWKYNIYIINADGTNRTKLTDDVYSLYPSWSPDGSKIAYSLSFLHNRGGIWIMNPDGSDKIKISDYGYWPSWSPDGSKIAFERGAKIYTMNADGTNQICLTNNSFFNDFPSWSPDGSKIAFVSLNPNEPMAISYIYVMNADGSNQTKLNRGDYPSWSPDGTKIALAHSGLCTMNSDGSNKINITKKWDKNWIYSIGHLSWSPFIH